MLQSIGPRSFKPGYYPCICAIDSKCRTPTAIYDADMLFEHHTMFTVRYTAPGLVTGCSLVGSLMLSTLDCYFSHSDCFPTLMSYSKQTYLAGVEHSLWFDAQPLVYDPARSRFPPETPVSVIVTDMMLERWNFASFYERFYNACAPSHCTYRVEARSNSILDTIIATVSIIATLHLALRIAIPFSIRVIFYLWGKWCKRRERQQHSSVQPGHWHTSCDECSFLVCVSICRRSWAFVQLILKRLYAWLTTFSIFLQRDFGSDVERPIAKHLGRWATRLYAASFAVGFVMLALYTILQSRTLTDVYNQPSINTYRGLFQFYDVQLKCPCASITTRYYRFVTLDTVPHEVSRDRAKGDS